MQTNPSWLLASLYLLSAPLSAQTPTTYKNSEYGFQIQIPKDFNPVPLQPEENWIVAKYVYKRPLEGKIDYAAMAPEIRVIVFPDDATKVSAKRFERKDESGSVDRLTIVENPAGIPPAPSAEPVVAPPAPESGDEKPRKGEL
jgi:hypothetical protein